MSAKTLRTIVADKALRDAAQYNRESHDSVAVRGQDWVIQAWAAVRRDPGLSPDQAIKLWPVYWKAFSDETMRLASISVPSQ